MTRILLAAILLAGSASLAAAQSSTATSGTTKPMTTAPTSGQTHADGTPMWKPPPAARSGEKGLPTGPNSANGTPLEVKRKP